MSTNTLDIVNRRVKGESIREIALKHNITESDVQEILTENRTMLINSLPKFWGQLGKEQRPVMIQSLIAKGLTVSDVALQLGVSTATIYQYMQRAGITPPQRPRLKQRLNHIPSLTVPDSVMTIIMRRDVKGKTTAAVNMVHCDLSDEVRFLLALKEGAERRLKELKAV